jgi:hypothetical protein
MVNKLRGRRKENTIVSFIFAIFNGPSQMHWRETGLVVDEDYIFIDIYKFGFKN